MFSWLSIFLLSDLLFLFKHINWLLILLSVFLRYLSIKALICLHFDNLLLLALFGYYDVKPSIFRTLTILLVEVLILLEL